jgi:hypothetical protein
LKHHRKRHGSISIAPANDGTVSDNEWRFEHVDFIEVCSHHDRSGHDDGWDHGR